MEKVKDITNLLLSLKLLAHQTHLLSTSHADHLLAERVEKDLDEDIDLLKELYLYCFDDDTIASCSLTLESAFNFIKEVEPTASIDQCFSYILDVIHKLVTLCAEAQGALNPDSSGLSTALGDVARNLSQKGYLVKQRLK